MRRCKESTHRTVKWQITLHLVLLTQILNATFESLGVAVSGDPSSVFIHSQKNSKNSLYRMLLQLHVEGWVMLVLNTTRSLFFCTL